MAKAEFLFRRFCREGRYELLPELMQTPGYLDFQELAGGIAPMVDWALSLGYLEAARTILYESVDDKQTFFYEACHMGHSRIVGILLEDPQIDPAACRQLALMAACREGHTAIVERLCQHHAVNPAARDYLAAVRAIKHGQLGLLRYMLTCPRSAEFIQPGSRRFVHCAMKNGKLEALVLLLERDQESHTKLTGHQLEGLQIDVTRLSPELVRACVAGDLKALLAAFPVSFNSLHELDVLLGLSRHHPQVLAYLKFRQHAQLSHQALLRQTFEEEREGHLIHDLERGQAYGFLTSEQFLLLPYFDYDPRATQQFEEYSFKQID
jgi:hypothetical protein